MFPLQVEIVPVKQRSPLCSVEISWRSCPWLSHILIKCGHVVFLVCEVSPWQLLVVHPALVSLRASLSSACSRNHCKQIGHYFKIFEFAFHFWGLLHYTDIFTVTIKLKKITWGWFWFCPVHSAVPPSLSRSSSSCSVCLLTLSPVPDPWLASVRTVRPPCLPE